MHRGSRSSWWITGLLTVAIVPFTAHGQADERSQSERSDAKTRLESGIVFAKGGDTELKLDLAMPAEGEGPFPAIVCIHGGGWIGGEREKMKGTIEILARRGYVVISPDYRLAPRHPFPAAIEDCKAAVRWLRANADKYHVNPQWIGAFGFSAGAHLASLLGVTVKEDGLEGKGGNADQSSAVQAVVSFFGPTDFTRPVWSKEVQEQHLTPFLGGTAEEKAEVYRRASPLTYAGKKSPPFLFVHGTADTIVPITQSEAMAEKLQEAGVSARLISMDGEGHFYDWKHENRLKSIAHMMKFFDENLKK